MEKRSTDSKSRRRGHGEGTVYKWRGRWAAQLDLGAVGGRRQRRTFYGDTQQEVVGKLRAAAHATKRGAAIPLERQTFGAFVEKWLPTVRASIRERTFDDYRALLDHAVRSLGRISLAKLQPADLQRLYEERRKAGAAPRTVLHLHRAVYRCLRDAERWGDAARNVARLVDPPKAPRAEMHALTTEEARTLLRAAEGDRLEALLVLALLAGARQGELLGLSWRDVDFERGTISIHASLQPTSRGLELVEPKTARSRRLIEIEPRVVAALRRHRAAQLEERLAAGPAWQDRDFVFCDTIGRPLDGRRVLDQWFRPLLARVGLPLAVRFHDLRHSYASIALKEGVPGKIVQEALGHSTIAITMDLYTHVAPGMQREAARTMGAALFGG